jgi:ubiquinone/menaquinone biosynthesis C-methylase UbiE
VATDLSAVVRNVLGFCDLAGKAVISIGAGGGQLLELARDARSLLAVDIDPAGLEQTRARAGAIGLGPRFSSLCADVTTLSGMHGDVVLFEFSLHEVADPVAALAVAQRLAAEVVVLDHDRDSPWAFVVDEVAKVEQSWRAVLALSPLSSALFLGEQRFADVDELRARVASQGERALARAATYAGRAPVTIPFSYAVAALQGG